MSNPNQTQKANNLIESSFLFQFFKSQTLQIKGQYMTISIENRFSKKFSEAELLLMASQMLKAYSQTNLKQQLDKILGSA